MRFRRTKFQGHILSNTNTSNLKPLGLMLSRGDIKPQTQIQLDTYGQVLFCDDRWLLLGPASQLLNPLKRLSACLMPTRSQSDAFKPNLRKNHRPIAPFSTRRPTWKT